LVRGISIDCADAREDRKTAERAQRVGLSIATSKKLVERYVLEQT
jgi:hypothetical protein